jgi:hypothetical protein
VPKEKIGSWAKQSLAIVAEWKNTRFVFSGKLLDKFVEPNLPKWIPDIEMPYNSILC